jgi:hypothetical protein
MVIATALQAGCDRLWSEDMPDGMLVDGRLRIADPFMDRANTGQRRSCPRVNWLVTTTIIGMLQMIDIATHPAHIHKRISPVARNPCPRQGDRPRRWREPRATGPLSPFNPAGNSTP